MGARWLASAFSGPDMVRLLIGLRTPSRGGRCCETPASGWANTRSLAAKPTSSEVVVAFFPLVVETSDAENSQGCGNPDDHLPNQNQKVRLVLLRKPYDDFVYVREGTRPFSIGPSKGLRVLATG